MGRKAERLDFAKYRDRPADYCRDVLKVALTPTQQHILSLLGVSPYRVLVPSGHNVGKSFVAACAVNWWFDCFDPGLCLTTAPTDRQVRRILWKEVRLLRRGRGGFPGPKICQLWSAENHFAEGFTARDGDRFQGHHGLNVFAVFDEAEGVEPIFWEALEGMLGGERFGFLGTYNPTSQSAQTVEEERSGNYHLVRMSQLDHPNIRAELDGKPPPFPSAIRLPRLRETLRKWSQVVPADQASTALGDVQLAPGEWYRPGPVAQARILGRRPSTAFDAVISEWQVDRAIALTLPLIGPVQVGVDPAWMGDDASGIHARKGGVSIAHESHYGLDPVQLAARVESVVNALARTHKLDPRQIVVAVDTIGIGAGVYAVLLHAGYRAAAVNVCSESPDPEDTPNLRSALWFGMQEALGNGEVSLALLSRDVQNELKRQLLAPKYAMDKRGRRVVEEKAITKAAIGRSPDDADAFLLAYANVNAMPDRVAGRVQVPR